MSNDCAPPRWQSAPAESAHCRSAHAPADSLAGFSDWRRIGRGGDAVVYRAIQDDLGREVAIKVLTLDDEAAVRRFVREVQLMVALGRQHPNIAKVLQIGTSGLGRPCIVMDYYELGSLGQRLARTGPLSPAEVVAAGTVIADALAFAHSRGVLHRDVKPQNILVLPTSYVLADFGIARLVDSAHTGGPDRYSYRHASPQVLDGNVPSAADDIFSLGATLFHLLDGQPPFTRAGSRPDPAVAYVDRVRTAEPRPVTRPDVPPELAALIRRCLRKDPAERYGSAADVRDALSAMDSGWRGVACTDPPAASASAVAGPIRPLWDCAPGVAQSTADLTSIRLPAAPDHAAGPAYVPNPGRGTGPAVRLLVALGGVAVGLVLVLLWAMLARPGGSTVSGAEPAATPPERLANPALSPQNLRAAFVGSRVRVTWQRPVEAPRYYLIGIASGPAEQTLVVDQPLFDTTTAEVAVEPTWPEVCVAVIGVRDGETGFEQECISR